MERSLLKTTRKKETKLFGHFYKEEGIEKRIVFGNID